jgi:hypothetical protein
MINNRIIGMCFAALAKSGGLAVMLILFICCSKDDPKPPDHPACFNPDKVRAAHKKVTDFLNSNEAGYSNGTIAKDLIGLYIDMVATRERMDLYISTIALGPGLKYTNDDGTEVTIDEQMIWDYKEALCDEVDHVNKKL